MLSTVLVIGFTLVAAWTDLVWHKIYNTVTYPGIAVALVVNGLEHGWSEPAGLEDSLKGLLVCGGLMLVAFVLFNVGGGDVKLLAMQGAFLGVERGLEAVLWTFVIGGAAALTIVFWKAGALRCLAGFARHVFWSLRLGRFQPLAETERRLLEPPLYLAAAAVPAVLIVCFDLDRYFGGW